MFVLISTFYYLKDTLFTSKGILYTFYEINDIFYKDFSNFMYKQPRIKNTASFTGYLKRIFFVTSLSFFNFMPTRCLCAESLN